MLLSNPFDGITLDIGTDAGMRAVETMIQDHIVTLRVQDPPCGHRLKIERLYPVKIPLIRDTYAIAVITKIVYVDQSTRDVTLRGVGIVTPR